MLSYPTWHHILPHLGIITKLSILSRCPHLAKSLGPTKIRHLSVSSGKIEFDGEVIQIGVIRNFPKNPRWVQEENRRGGSFEEVDRYGFKIRENPKHLLQDLKADVDCFRRDLNTNLSQTPKTSHLLISGLENRFLRDTEKMRHLIEICNLQLTQAPPNFDLFIQIVTKRDKNLYLYGQKTVECAVKEMIRKMFNGQKVIVQKIEVQEKYDPNFNFNLSWALDALENYFDFRNHPLHSITMVGGSNYSRQIIGTARELIIKGPCRETIPHNSRIIYRNINNYVLNHFWNPLGIVTQLRIQVGAHVSFETNKSIMMDYLRHLRLRNHTIVTLPETRYTNYPNGYMVHQDDRLEVNFFWENLNGDNFMVHFKTYQNGYATIV